ncbi:MAG: UbiA family prenyltransferase [Euryarchaeota archaeon]|nr:UbiA family prenyltransferase [Euryarchaeota archaeon]
MNQLFRGYVDLLRPFTLLAPLVVSSCVMIASFVYTGKLDFSFSTIVFTILAASFTLALVNGASNALNQATDIHEDRLSKPYRPIPRGIITSKEAKITASVLYACAFLLSLTVHILFAAFVGIIMVFSITYSIYPRMKRVLSMNQLWVALPRGLFGILASWSVFSDPFQPVPLAIGSIAALFLFGGTTTKDILDASADKTAGIQTLVNVVGVKTTACIACLCMSTAFLLIPLLIMFKVLALYLLPLALLSVLALYIAWLMTHDKKNERYENTSSWTLMYATYLLFALGFAFLTISFS